MKDYVNEYDAYKTFQAKAKGPVNQSDFDWALRETVREMQTDIPARSGRKAGYRECVADALDLLLTWYNNGAESVVKLEWGDLAQFLCKRRPGAAWATFLRKSHEKE